MIFLLINTRETEVAMLHSMTDTVINVLITLHQHCTVQVANVIVLISLHHCITDGF